ASGNLPVLPLCSGKTGQPYLNCCGELMSPLANVGLLLINTIGSLALLIVLLRFLLQLVRADFYNPISQMIVKLTSPLLTPLRRVIPGFGGLDIASLLLAYGIQIVTMALILLVAGMGADIPWANL